MCKSAKIVFQHAVKFGIMRKQCGYRITAIIEGFQPFDAGSTPATRSKF